MTDFDRLRQQLLSWPGIDPITWRYLLPGRVPKLSQFSDSPIRRELASAWVWAKASSGDFRLAPTGLTRSPYQFELFARSFIPKLEPRLSLLANFVGWNPQQSQSNLRGMLIGQLIEEGRLAPRTTNGHLDEDLAERALRFVSADSGIDRETILAGSKSPAVKAARHLAASLMKTTAGCNWTPIGEYFGTRGNSSSIRPTFKGQTGSIPESLKDRHQVLLDQIRNASVVAPPFSEGGHRGKMDRLALGIREAAATHFDDVSPRSPGSRFSQLICRELTDLTWGAIYRLHGETNQLGARELIALEEAKKSDPGLKTRERHLRVDASALAASVRNGQGS